MKYSLFNTFKTKKALVFSSVLVISSVALLNGCSKKEEIIASSDKRSTSSQAEKTINIKTLNDLRSVFMEYNYTKKAWNERKKAIPRMTFGKVGVKWKKTSSKLAVKEKKSIFFRLMTPLILISNENILHERKIVLDSALNAAALKDIAVKYKVIKSTEEVIDEAMKAELLRRVDIIPPSLALAQAAEESGWGTSRFTHEGNAFFGQWDFSGKGMKPKEQRKELGDYGLARFDSPLASVEGYMFNINISSAYEKLRQLRAQIRLNEQPIIGIRLAGTLDKYSERGQAYIDGIRHMIRYNKLEFVDQAYLADNSQVHLE